MSLPSPEEVRAEAIYRRHLWAVGHARPGRPPRVAVLLRKNPATEAVVTGSERSEPEMVGRAPTTPECTEIA